MKKLILVMVFFTAINLFAQVGIGTTTPYNTSILDLNASNKALLLTRVANTAAIPSPTNGMMIYDSSSKCIKSYENGAWTGCLSGSKTNTADVTVDCDLTGFLGNYYNTLPLNSSNKYYVTVTNNTFSNVNITFATSDLVLSGVTGVSVASVLPSGSVAFTSGQSRVIEYTLSGTPTTTGTLIGRWTKGLLTCEKNTVVLAKPTFVASLATTSALTNSYDGSIANVDIASSSFNSNSNAALLASSLFNANGDFVAPYSGSYTFRFDSWSRNVSGFQHWNFFSSKGYIFTQTTSSGPVTVIYNLTAGEVVYFQHQACQGCNPITSVNFGNVAFQVSF